MFRLLSSLLLSCSFCAAQTADPRLSQVLPNLKLPYEWKIEDTNHDGWPDIVSHAPSSQDYGVLISNLGHRSFGPTRITHRLRLYDSRDSNGSLVRLDESQAFYSFFNQCEVSGNTTTFTPCVVPLQDKGHFEARRILGETSKTPWVPLDLDGDGITEFIQQEPHSFSGNDYRIFDRQADGSYLPQTITFPDSFSPGSLYLRDLDLDGDPDLICHSTGYDIIAMERTGPRTFANRGTLLEDHYYATEPPADLDGDGAADIYSRDRSTIRWFRNLGNFTFSPVATITSDWMMNRQVFKVTSNPGSPAIHHIFDSPAHGLEIIDVPFGSGSPSRYQLLSRANLGSHYPYLSARALEDLDRDGYPDLLLDVYSTYQDGPQELHIGRLAVAWGSAAGYSPPSFIDQTPITDRIVLTEDFDGNGSIDIIVGPDLEDRFHFLANKGDGTFQPHRVSQGIAADGQMPAGAYVAGIKAARLDGDAHMDLAIDYAVISSGTYSSARVIASGDGVGNFLRPQLAAGDFVPSGNQPRLIDHLVDWDGDGWTDAITRGALQKNLGGVFSPTSQTLITPAPASVYHFATEIGDLDGDGRPDIVNPAYTAKTVNYQPVGTLGIGYNNGQGGTDPIVEVPINMLARDLYDRSVAGQVRIADVNDDGLSDLVTFQLSTYDILGNALRSPYLRYNPAAGSRTPAVWRQESLYRFPSGPPLDFNGDGKKEFADLQYCLTPSSPRPQLSSRYDLLGGVNLTGYETIYPADFDADGDTDFLVHCDYANLTMVRNPNVEERSGITRSLISQGVRPDKAAPSADADGDGRSNQTEIIFGTDPLASDIPNPNPLDLHLRTDDGNTSLTFKTPALPPSLKATHELEWSQDLIHWEPATGLQQNVTSQSNGWLRMQTLIPALGEKGFYRIRGIHDLDKE